MNDRNSSFENGLRCLQHPATLFSILVLLFNDHILKFVAPSWLTGKLSDFSGLFFFPFIVTAVLGMVLGKSNVKSRNIGMIAFGIVGTLFFLLKTFKEFNLFFGNVISSLLGYPVQYVMDPTDVAALVVLLPAWKMWNTPPNSPPRRLAWIALTIGSLASLATSPAQPQIEQVEDFIYHKDILYVADSDQTPQFIAMTGDLGENWESLYEPEDQDLIDKIKSLATHQEFAVRACDPNNVKLCYRTVLGTKVEISTNAGSNWETAWQIPEERSYFVKRKRDNSVNLKAYDLIILQQNNQSVLLVALGSEGVLRRELPNGEWQRIAVGWAHPTPYQENNFEDAFNFVISEQIIWLGLALLYFALTMRWHRRRKSGDMADSMNTYAYGFIYPFAYLVTSLILFSLFTYVLTSFTGIGFILYVLLYLPFFVEAISVAGAQNNLKSILTGIFLPGATYIVVLAIFAITAIAILVFPDISRPSLDGSNWLNELIQLLGVFVQYILPLLVCAVIFWSGLRNGIKSIKTLGVGRIFFIHLFMSILIASTALFFVPWALGTIPRYGSAFIWSTASFIALILIGLYISGFLQRKTGEKG